MQRRCLGQKGRQTGVQVNKAEEKKQADIRQVYSYSLKRRKRSRENKAVQREQSWPCSLLVHSLGKDGKSKAVKTFCGHSVCCFQLHAAGDNLSPTSHADMHCVSIYGVLQVVTHITLH